MTLAPAKLARLALSPIMVLILAVLLLVAGFGVAFYQQQLYGEQKARELTVQADILAASVSAALDFNDHETAQEYVNALEANPELQAAGVYDASGALIANFVREGTLLPRNIRVTPPAFTEDALVVTARVNQNRASLGVVYLRANMESLDRRLARYSVIIVLVGMAALLLIVLASFQVQLTRANRELENRAGDLADANRKLYSEMEEREKAEDALRQSQKMEAIGQLSGGIAHDFNNLLTIVKGNLQLLQRRIREGQSDVGRYVDSAMEGLNRGAILTQRILAFSRRQPLSPCPVDLTQLIGNMDELLRHAVGERVQIETRFHADWWILCDPNQMENVILNLANNARDAMPQGGRFTIVTDNVHLDGPDPRAQDAAPGDYVRLTIADAGTGMSEEVLSRAVDPFFTTKPQGKGTGLGLSMTFGYIRQSNGYLGIASEMGKGTTITILMPRCDPAAVAMRA